MTPGNLDRLILGVGGMILVLLGSWPLRSRSGLAITLSTLGTATFVLAVILPRVRSFSVGIKGLHARLDRLEPKVEEINEKVNQIIEIGTAHETDIAMPLLAKKSKVIGTAYERDIAGPVSRQSEEASPEGTGQ